MKKKMMFLAAVIMTAAMLGGCGKTYTCSWCGVDTRKAYYDAHDTDAYFCEECAREYYAPFSCEGFRVK